MTVLTIHMYNSIYAMYVYNVCVYYNFLQYTDTGTDNPGVEPGRGFGCFNKCDHACCPSMRPLPSC